MLTIENSRSGDEMLRALAKYGYSRDIGAGVYDVHSPVVPPCAPNLFALPPGFLPYRHSPMQCTVAVLTNACLESTVLSPTVDL